MENRYLVPSRDEEERNTNHRNPEQSPPRDDMRHHASKTAYYQHLVRHVLERYTAKPRSTNQTTTQKEDDVDCANHRNMTTTHSKEFCEWCVERFDHNNHDERFSTSSSKHSDTQQSSKSDQCQTRTLPATKDVIEQITAEDVLFGRRSAQRKHSGNVRLRELCCQLHQEYKDGNRGQKTSLTEGGRFLRLQKDGNATVWCQVSNDIAREKVAFTIRDLSLMNAESV